MSTAPAPRLGRPLLTVRQAAATLNVSPAAVRRWLSRRLLPALRVGRCIRIEPAALEAFVRERT